MDTHTNFEHEFIQVNEFDTSPQDLEFSSSKNFSCYIFLVDEKRRQELSYERNANKRSGYNYDMGWNTNSDTELLFGDLQSDDEMACNFPSLKPGSIRPSEVSSSNLLQSKFSSITSLELNTIDYFNSGTEVSTILFKFFRNR